jgi:putative hydrolases of HD superfamily
MNLDDALALTRLSLDFGQVNRATRHADGVKLESDTTHTVMLGLIAVTLAHEYNAQPSNYARRLSPGTVALYALVHDLVEAKCGDTLSLGISKVDAEAKHAREAAALEELGREFGRLHWMFQMIQDYERQEIPEARFVRYLDKVLPKLTHILNRCAAVVAAGFTAEDLAREHTSQHLALWRQYGEFPIVYRLFEEAATAAQNAYFDPGPFTEENEDYGDLMTLDDFRGSVECGAICDDDGSGCASNGTHHVDDRIDLYDLRDAALPPGTTHVLWYNK